MKTIFRLVLLSILLLGMAAVLPAQNSEVTHNTWTKGAAMPTARFGAFAGAIGKYIYVIGGATNSKYEVTSVNEIYDTKKNTWKTGAPDPTPRELGASAVVKGILYVIGGSTSGSTPLNLVETYDPKTNSWTTKASMPTPRNSMPAVVDGETIYVIGGYDPDTDFWYDTVESYNTSTDTWTEESPLLMAKAWSAVGLLNGAIFDAEGQKNGSGGTPVSDNESYKVKKNTWTTVTAAPTPRLESCFAAIKNQLYIAGGVNATGLLSLTQAYNAKNKTWTTLAPMPYAVETAASATDGGLLYCFGGSSSNLGNVYDYVQIYQP